MSENFVKGIGLLDSKEANAKDQGESEGSHNDTPYTKSVKEQSDEKIDDVASTEGKEGLENLRAFQSRNNWVGSLDGHTQHDQTYEGNEGSANEVKVNPPCCEIDGHGNVELENRRRQKLEFTKRKNAS